MQTCHLTIVEVNPVQRKDIPLIDISDEPKQKAIKMTPMSCINIAQVNKVKLDMLKDAAEDKHKDVAEQKKNSKHEFCVRAEAPLLTKQFSLMIRLLSVLKNSLRYVSDLSSQMQQVISR